MHYALGGRWSWSVGKANIVAVGVKRGDAGGDAGNPGRWQCQELQTLVYIDKDMRTVHGGADIMRTPSPALATRKLQSEPLIGLLLVPSAHAVLIMLPNPTLVDGRPYGEQGPPPQRLTFVLIGGGARLL